MSGGDFYTVNYTLSSSIGLQWGDAESSRLTLD